MMYFTHGWEQSAYKSEHRRHHAPRAARWPRVRSIAYGRACHARGHLWLCREWEASMASWTEIEYLRTMNQLFYDQVKTADQKAGYICTFLTILFAWSKDRGKVLLFL